MVLGKADCFDNHPITMSGCLQNCLSALWERPLLSDIYRKKIVLQWLQLYFRFVIWYLCLHNFHECIVKVKAKLKAFLWFYKFKYTDIPTTFLKVSSKSMISVYNLRSATVTANLDFIQNYEIPVMLNSDTHS